MELYMNTLTIQEIKELLETIKDENDDVILSLTKDSRKGVQTVLNKWKKDRQKEREEIIRYQSMMQYENEAKSEGYQLIAGIDEVGRGPLAGPVVSAAVILPDYHFLKGLNDSKKLSETKRLELYEAIKENAISYSVGIINPDEIDRINIYEATKKSMLAALQNLSIKPEFLLLDAIELNSIYPERSLIKGDSKSVSIAAASIIAKVTRDKIMEEAHRLYPNYGFDKHVGYGTKFHLEAIEKYGPCPIHRKSFAPIKSYSEEGVR